MEQLESWLLFDYPKVDPYASVNSVMDQLREKNYVVLGDEKNECYGILMSQDVLLRPHVLAIDCMRQRQHIDTSDSYLTIREKFVNASAEALPVYHEGNFLGILEKSSAINKMIDMLDSKMNDSKSYPKLKSSLLHYISHEVRTPLNHVVGFMSLMSEMTESDLVGNAQQYQTIVQHGSKRFLRFMNDLIELSLLEAGESLELFFDWFSPEDLFNEMVSQLDMDEFENKINAKITIAVEKSLMAYSDVARVRQVLSHMLDMMIYHPGKESSISLGAFRDTIKRNVVLFVRNDSIILEKYQSELITSTFYNSARKGNCEFDFRLDLVHRVLEKIGCSCRMEIDDSSRITVFVFIEDKQENESN